MSTKSKARKKAILGSMRPEFFIMVAIILFVCWQLAYEDALSSEGALTMDQNGSFIVVTDDKRAEELIDSGKAIANFNPNTCRTINVCDENLVPVWEMFFVETSDPYSTSDQSQFPGGIEKFQDDQGTFTYTASDGDEVRVTFKWSTAPSGKRYLMSFSTSLIKERNHKQQIAISYIIITLCFVMLTNVLYWQLHGTANRYKRLIKEQQAIINGTLP